MLAEYIIGTLLCICVLAPCLFAGAIFAIFAFDYPPKCIEKYHLTIPVFVLFTVVGCVFLIIGEIYYTIKQFFKSFI